MPHLLVPIHLDALPVAKDRTVLGAMADFSKLPYFNGQGDVHSGRAYLSEEIVSHPFRDQDWLLRPGVHLHWALPDGLTKTMGMPIVRRQAFFTVFGKDEGSEIWNKLLDPVNGWLTPIDNVTAWVAAREKWKTAPSEMHFGEALIQIEQLLSQPTFPAVPNRWLIVRHQKNQQPLSWVVESDYLFTAPNLYDPDNALDFGSVAFPVEADTLPKLGQSVAKDQLPGVPFRYMGRRLPLTAWNEAYADHPMNYLSDPLTAVGYGEPNFAAFYPNCHSIFGFFDEKFGLTSKQLAGVTYTVCGWYDDIKHDYYNYFTTHFQLNSADDRPREMQLLAAIKTEFGWQLPITVTTDAFAQDANLKDRVGAIWQQLIDLKWISAAANETTAMVLPFANTANTQLTGALRPFLSNIQKIINDHIVAQLPNRLICHAEIDFGDTPSLTAVPTSTDVEVAIGNTGTEALTTYLTAKIEAGKSATPEQIKAITAHLEAAQLASQLDDKLLDIGPRFQEALHSKEFIGTDAGTLWTVRKLSPSGQKADAEAAHGREQITLSLPLAHLLNELNRLQQAYDRATDEIDSLRHQIFADWSKYMVSVYPPPDQTVDYHDGDQIKYFMQQNDLRRLDAKIKAKGVLLLTRDEQGQVVKATADRTGTQADQLAVTINKLLFELIAHDTPSLETIHFKDFSTTQKLNLIGAAKVGDMKQLRLTPAAGGQGGVAWFTDKQPVNLPFSTTFTFQITDPVNSGADGIAFVIQNSSPTTIGYPGGGMGYSAIPNALAVELDTYNDADLFADPSSNHIAVLTRGQLPISDSHDYALGVAIEDIPILQDGAVHTVTIDYKPGELAVSIDQKKRVLVVSVDLADKLALDNGKAWVGLTAGTGAAWENHDILSWSFSTVDPKSFTLFGLHQTAAPRYWQPKDPVILLAGKDAKFTSRHGQDGQDDDNGLLQCQISDTTFSNPPTHKELDGMVNHLKKTINKKGIGYNNWLSQTWHPFMLEWAVDIYATRDPKAQQYDAPYAPTYLATNYNLPIDSDEFGITAENSGVIINPRPYTGFSILTPHVGEKLGNDLQRELLNLAHGAIKQAFHDWLPQSKQRGVPSDKEIVDQAASFNKWVAKVPDLKPCQPLNASSNETPFQQIQNWLQAKANWPHVVKWSQVVKWKVDGKLVTITAALIQTEREALQKAINATNPDAGTIEKAQQALHQSNVRFSLRTLANAYQALAGGNYLAQGLGGFNDALLGHKRTLQLPIADPLGFPDAMDNDPLAPGVTVVDKSIGDQGFAKVVETAVLNANRSAPQPHNPFLPIRAGAMNLSHLRLVDTFGRTKQIKPHNLQQVYLPQLLKSPYPDFAPISLRPRLAHPARLNFRWLAAIDQDIESNDQPATSPICGWLLPNNLDNSIMVYDQTGAPLGSLIASDRHTPWHPAPGFSLALPVAKIDDPVLRQVISNLVTNQVNSLTHDGKTTPNTFLDHFITTLDSALNHIAPENFARHQARSLLMGRPMAVVQAKVGLELQGLPAVDNSWTAFTHDLYAWSNWLKNTKSEKPKRSDRNYNQVTIPVRIGEYEQLNDGLVGYWPEKAEMPHQMSTTFYALQSSVIDDPHIKTRDPQHKHAQDGQHHDTDFHLNLSPASKAQTVTMLLDPRGTVHASCGILPTKELSIPPDQYMAALDGIEVTFLTTPLLTPKDEISLSLPAEPGYSWRWLGKDFAGNWRELGTVGILKQEQLVGQFNGAQVSGLDVWQALLSAGWIKAVDPRKAKVVPTDQRRNSELDARFKSLLPQIEAILASTHITPFNTDAVDTGSQVIREGWLKLKKEEEEEEGV